MINAHSHAQDLRWIGNLIQSIPVTASCLLIANRALCGIPFTAGFYSKDIIIESSIMYNCNSFIIFLILLSVRFTSFYSIRISIVVLWGPRLHKPISMLSDTNTVSNPIIFISLTSIVIGAAIVWVMPTTENQITLPLQLKILTILIVVVGVITGWAASHTLSHTQTTSANNIWHYASCIIWFLVPITSQITLNLPLTSGHLILKIIDQSWLEAFGAQGISSAIISSSSSIQIKSPTAPNMYITISILLITATPVIIIVI
jgi:NADH-ubiquinone oxidoreductase chain 5